MHSKFLNIDIEKQHRIINACIKEFSEKGYSNASTNEIIKNAQISKGLLFHYFKNKKYLFLFIYDYSVNALMKDFYEKIDMDETDFFKKIIQTVLIKIELISKYPNILKFLEICYTEDSSEIKSDLDEVHSTLLSSTVSNIFKNIDTSKFKDDVDISKAINITLWTLEGYSNSVINAHKISNTELNYDKSFEEYFKYLEILKQSFYK